MKTKKFNIVLITYHKDGTKSRNIVDTVKGIRKANEICRINNMKNDTDCVYLNEEVKGIPMTNMHDLDKVMGW